MTIFIVAPDGWPTYAPETATATVVSASTSGASTGAIAMSTYASPAGIVADSIPGGTTAARPSPENATSNVSAGRPVESASAREMRKTPGVRVPSSAFARTSTASAPAWSAAGQAAETVVPLAEVARTLAL